MKSYNILVWIKTQKLYIFVFLAALIFSSVIMFSSFSYKDGNMVIGTKAWSDFASHIPLIRSFSLGENFPPQYPLFSGPSIKYHFIFYFFVGLFEKLGLRIDYALNIPSIIGFSLLILIIFVFANKLFKSIFVGIISVLFFVFNGTLDFLNFFKIHPISSNSIYDIFKNQDFVSFGPYDSSIISAFWNLNIYTNQRHLGLSYFISLIIIFFAIKPFIDNKKGNLKNYVIIGILLGLTFFINMAVFLMTNIVLFLFLLFLKGHRKNILATLIFSIILFLPQYLYSQNGLSSFKISYYSGYLIHNSLSFQSFINYWYQNLGLHLFLIPIGFLISPKKAKIIFISFLSLFIVGNLVQFSPEIAANHKFFNYFMIIGSAFSAYFLYRTWLLNNILKPVVILLIFVLTFSGIIDLFPILNDKTINLADYSANKDVSWILKNTKPDSIFLNTQYLYDNASVAGRSIFLGWPYFAWSQGYNTLTRDNLRKDLLSTDDLRFFCQNSLVNKLDFVEISEFSQDAKINKIFFDNNFDKIYSNTRSGVYIYDIKKGCT